MTKSMISFDFVSPEKLLFNDEVGMIIVPGKDGDIGVLPGHSKLLSSLRSGRVMVYGEGKQLLKSFFVSGGFVEVNPDKCILLAEEVFEMSELDKSAIEQQIQELKNETSDKSKQQYLIAKSKIISGNVDSTHMRTMKERDMKDSFIQFWQNHSEAIVALGYNLILAIVILVASSLIARAVRKAIQDTNSKLKKVDATLIPIFSTVASYAVYVIGGVFILDIFGVNTASLIALVGAAGLAVGLALKDTLSNIAAGIMLLILRPFKSGDFIEFGSTQGTVKEINLFTTVLETIDGLYIASPNSVLWGNNIKNFTRNGKRRMDIVVGISYSDSIDDAFKILQGVAENESRLMTDPAPQVMVASMADSAVNIQLRAWATNENYWSAYWDLNKQVKEAIEAAGLTIPFPQRTLHIIENSSSK